MLAGKTALVTGSTGPIGDAVAEALAARGCAVMLHGLGDERALEHRRQTLGERYEVTVGHSDSDLSSPEGVKTLIAETRNRLGSIEVLVNAAGIQHVASLVEFPLEHLQAILNINLLASIVATQLVLPEMKARRWGRIVNVASAHGLVASPFKVPYTASKHGMVGLTKGTALEVGEFDITCNALAPGFVDTPMFHEPSRELAEDEGVDPEVLKERLIRQKHAIPRLIPAEEIAETVVFLCSPAARSITGTVLSIDCGWTAQ